MVDFIKSFKKVIKNFIYGGLVFFKKVIKLVKTKNVTKTKLDKRKPMLKIIDKNIVQKQQKLRLNKMFQSFTCRI